MDSLAADQVTITHSKVPTALKTSTKPVHVITRSDALSFGLTELDQVLDITAGINVNGSLSNPAKDRSVYLQGASPEYTLFLVDGIPVTDPSAIGSTFDIRQLSMDQVDRIEILKGSHSTLYGSEAMAGVINIITRSDKQTGQNLMAHASLSSVQTLKTGINFSNHTSNMGYSLALNGLTTKGISEAFSRDGTSFDNDPLRKWGGQIQGELLSNSPIQIRPYIRFNKLNGDFDGGAFLDSEDRYESDWLNSGINLKYKGETHSFNLDYNFSQTNRSFNTSFGLSEFKGRFNQLDGFGNIEFNESMQLMYGINIQDQKMLDMGSTEDPNATIWSPYANLIAKVSDEFNVEAGIRFNDHSEFGQQTNFSGGLSYWLGNSLKLYSSYGTAFKTPNLFQLYGQFGANPSLKPQTSKSLQTGFHMGSSDHKIKFDLLYFNRTIDNIIVFLFDPGYVNRDRQHDQGIDFSGSWLMPHGGRIRFSYNYLHARTFTDEIEIERDLLRRPNHQFEFQYGQDFSPSVSAFVHVRRTGIRSDLFFNPDTFVNDPVELGAYWLIDLGLRKKLSPESSIHVRISNLGDAEFQEIYGFSTLGIQGHINFIYQR